MNLLDYMVEKTNCTFISDLKNTDDWKGVLTSLKRKEDIDTLFSIEDWNHCVDYLSKRKNPKHFTNVKEAIDYLLAE